FNAAAFHIPEEMRLRRLVNQQAVTPDSPLEAILLLASPPLSRLRGANPRINGDPVDLPTLAAILRERLLEPHRIRIDRRNHKPHQHRPSLVLLLVVELPNPTLEAADRRRRQRPAAAA